MARTARISLPQALHLIQQRGHGLTSVFKDEEDRQRYLNDLREAARLHKVAVHAYALADQSVTLLATPSTEEGLGRMLQTVGRRYVVWHNRRHGQRGSLWEGRYRACLVEPGTEGLNCLRYIECWKAPPVWEPGQDSPHPQAWSSAAHHLGLVHDSLLTPHAVYWALGNTPFEREMNYRHIWLAGLGSSEASRLDAALTAGRPLGDAPYVQWLAQQLHRDLQPKPRGRPPKVLSRT